MQKIWLSRYPEAIPHEIDASRYSNALDIFKEGVKKHANKPAYSNFNHTISFADLDKMSRSYASYLQNELGLVKGDRIGIMLPNVMQYPVAVFAAMYVGLVIVNIDPLYTQRELKLQLNDSGAKALLVLENFAKEVERAMPECEHLEHIIITKLGDCLPSFKGFLLNFALKFIKKAIPSYKIVKKINFKNTLAYDAEKLVSPELDQDDLLFLQYTGGTTGVPKGVELTHGNIVANVLQSSLWLEPVMNNIDSPRMISPLPMYHIYCMSGSILSAPIYGVENVLITNPRDFDGFVKFLKKQRFTGISGVNTLYRKLMDTKGFDEIDFSHLRFSFAGGMAITRDVADEWFQRTGCMILEGYGLSETSPGAVINLIDNKEFSGTVGVPLPSTDIKILDDDDKELGIGEIGELCIKGPQVMRGYWNRPDETAKVMTDDGYLRTGDYVSMDERGEIKIHDRKKDMILVSGFNVFPNEIEDVVNQHPEVIESAAIGIDDREAGQVVKLFVVSKNKHLTEQDVLDFCRENLTGYKRPKVVEFRDEELPKSNVGKILRKNLRA